MVVGSVSATLRQEFPTAVSPARSIPPSANRKRLRSKLRVFHSVRGEFGPWDHPFTTADGCVASPMFGLGRVGSGCGPWAMTRQDTASPELSTITWPEIDQCAFSKSHLRRFAPADRTTLPDGGLIGGQTL